MVNWLVDIRNLNFPVSPPTSTTVPEGEEKEQPDIQEQDCTVPSSPTRTKGEVIGLLWPSPVDKNFPMATPAAYMALPTSPPDVPGALPAWSNPHMNGYRSAARGRQHRLATLTSTSTSTSPRPGVALEEGSEVYLWYEDLTEAHKKSWKTLSGLIKTRYGSSVESKRRALREMLTAKLADGDVRVTGSDGEEKHITWSKKVATLDYQAGKRGDQSTLEIVFNNVGPYTQSYLTSQNALDSVRTLATAPESMSSSCAGRTRHAAGQDQRIQDLERIVRQRSQPLMSSSSNYLQPSAMGLITSYQRQSYEPKRTGRQ